MSHFTSMITGPITKLVRAVFYQSSLLLSGNKTLFLRPLSTVIHCKFCSFSFHFLILVSKCTPLQIDKYRICFCVCVSITLTVHPLHTHWLLGLFPVPNCCRRGLCARPLSCPTKDVFVCVSRTVFQTRFLEHKIAIRDVW